MSSSKAFVVSVNPRDALVDMKDLSPEAAGILFKFWMLHEMHREPLPPREEKRPRAEWDEWFRDKLDMKNVRTWRRIKAELLGKAKIRQADDGRLYIARTMRAIERKRGGDPSRWGSADDDGQGSFDLQGVHCAQRRGDNPVDEAGENPALPDVWPNIGQTSPDVWPKWPPKSLELKERLPAYSYSYSKSLHEVVAATESRCRARASVAAWSLARAGPAAHA